MCTESYKIINIDGDINYFKNGTKPKKRYFHRTDGPAHEHTNGYKSWCIENKWHREDGPAIIWPLGSKAFYLNNKYYSEEDYWNEIKKFRKQKIKDL